MPLVVGNEVDGGYDHNNTNFQNMLAYIGGCFIIGCDFYFIYRGCPGHSYLNTPERAMPILNIALANHTVCIDPNSTMWLRNILHRLSSMHDVQKEITNFDEELKNHQIQTTKTQG